MVEFLRSKTMEAIERLSTLSSSSAAAVEEEDTTTIENIFSFPSTAKHLSSNIDSNSFTVFSFDTLHSCLDMMLQDEENLQYDTELTNYTKYRATRVDDLGEYFSNAAFSLTGPVFSYYRNGNGYGGIA